MSKYCTCGHVPECHSNDHRAGRPCSGFDAEAASGMCGCQGYVEAASASSGAREPDAWCDAKAVRGTLVEIVSESDKRGALVHAMGGTYQTYGHLVDALLYRTPAPSEPEVTEAMVEEGAKGMVEQAGLVWEDASELTKRLFRTDARACLTAALKESRDA